MLRNPHAAAPLASEFVSLTLTPAAPAHAEMTHLKVSDIDSQSMVSAHPWWQAAAKIAMSASQSYGGTQHQLAFIYHRTIPVTLLFPSNYRKEYGPIDAKTVWYAGQKAAQRAGPPELVYPHLLRNVCDRI